MVTIPALGAVFLGKLARRMEVRADAAATQNQASEGVYARALERLYQVSHIPVVMPGKRKVHPHLYDRMIAAGVTPEYPRPTPPKPNAWPARVMWFAAGVLMGILAAERWFN
jgi:hypothetical protein